MKKVKINQKDISELKNIQNLKRVEERLASLEYKKIEEEMKKEDELIKKINQEIRDYSSNIVILNNDK